VFVVVAAAAAAVVVVAVVVAAAVAIDLLRCDDPIGLSSTDSDSSEANDKMCSHTNRLPRLSMETAGIGFVSFRFVSGLGCNFRSSKIWFTEPDPSLHCVLRKPAIQKDRNCCHVCLLARKLSIHSFIHSEHTGGLLGLACLTAVRNERTFLVLKSTRNIMENDCYARFSRAVNGKNSLCGRVASKVVAS
jgi:hypothetical protein